MNSPQFRTLIPAAIVVVFLGCAVALVFELLVAAAAGRSSDSAATTALGAVLAACVPALVALYLRDTAPPPRANLDEEEEKIVRESRSVLRKYLDQFIGGTKWKPGFTE